jgi:N-acetylglucosamine kinase-like BadF-type ATPase
MKLFLGLDGGQSSTTALIGDENGRVIGIGRAGPCNHARSGEGREKFLRAMRESIRAAGIADPQFECACLGLSGGPADKDSLAREVIRAHQFVITHDAAIALSGALAGAPGIIAIAGTGSIAFGKNAAGRTVRAGGWGYIFGDEGSAFGIVRSALRAVLRHHEGWGAPTRLSDALLEFTGSRDPDDLLHRFYSDEFPRSRIASLATVVDQAAMSGDSVAREILKDAAQSLVTLVSAVRGQLFKSGEHPKLSHHGGVFRGAILLERFQTLAEFSGSEVTAPKYSPAAGALLEAYRACGIDCELTGAPPEKL